MLAAAAAAAAAIGVRHSSSSSFLAHSRWQNTLQLSDYKLSSSSSSPASSDAHSTTFQRRGSKTWASDWQTGVKGRKGINKRPRYKATRHWYWCFDTRAVYENKCVRVFIEAAAAAAIFSINKCRVVITVYQPTVTTTNQSPPTLTCVLTRLISSCTWSTPLCTHTPNSGAAFTKYFHNSSTIFLRFFYDYSLRAFTVFSARNPSQPQQGKSFPEFGMHQILLQFFHKIAVESLFPY
jgi:hypothetical protein